MTKSDKSKVNASVIEALQNNQHMSLSEKARLIERVRAESEQLVTEARELETVRPPAV